MGLFKRKEPGLIFPSEFYYWPDDADAAHNVRLEEWRQDYARGNDYPIPDRDLNRVVFLETNMPPELAGQSVEGLMEAGVRRIPGDAAADYIVQHWEIDHGAVRNDRERAKLLQRYLDQAGWKSSA